LGYLEEGVETALPCRTYQSFGFEGGESVWVSKTKNTLKASRTAEEKAEGKSSAGHKWTRLEEHRAKSSPQCWDSDVKGHKLSSGACL